MSVADSERSEIYRSWLADLERDAKVHWVRPPDPVSRRGDTEETSSDTAGL